MGDRAADLARLVGPVVTGLGYELVGIEHRMGRGAGLLRVFIDHEAGIGVDDCERVSRQVSALLDVEDPIAGAFTLEVSSPGLDRPLYTPEHYARHAGSTVQVRLRMLLNGRRKIVGAIESADGEGVTINEGGSAVRVAYGDIERGRLVPDLPLPAARRGRSGQATGKT